MPNKMLHSSVSTDLVDDVTFEGAYRDYAQRCGSDETLSLGDLIEQ